MLISCKALFMVMHLLLLVEKKGKLYGELTLYRKNRLKLVNAKPVDLGINKFEKIIMRHSGQRSSLITEFKFDNQKIIVVNLHLVLLAWHSIRRKQINTILEVIGQTDDPLIFVGDFNYSNRIIVSSLIKLMAQKGFSLASKDLVTHRFLGFYHQLDYVFYKNCKVGEINVGDINYSDHFPLYLELEF